MAEEWKNKLSCALECMRCGTGLKFQDKRILSVYDHEPICMSCKGKEEKLPDYEETARNLIGTCMADTELMYSDPGGYCYFHFYPFTC